MKSAVRIAVWYAVFSGAYIVLSDWLALQSSRWDPTLLTIWQNFKGMAFVLISALIIFFFVWRYARSCERTRQLLQKALESFQYLFERNPLPICVYDVESLRFLAVNEAMAKEYGYSQEEFLRMRITDIRPAEDMEKIIAHVIRVKHRPFTGPSRHVRKDGTVIDVEIVSHSMEFNGCDARLAVATNVTIRKVAEQAMAEAFATRAEAEKAKSRFLSSISHEMRTPLNAITGSLDLLALETSEEKRESYLEIAHGGTAELLALINRLIQAAALKSQSVSLRTSEIDLQPFLQQVADEFFVVTKNKGVKLDIVCDNSLPERVRIDVARLDEILQILLDNAIKFSHGGRVEVCALMKEGRLVLAVMDEGIGIPQEMQERIFESFTQAEEGAARHYGGAGLGLFVARQLCDLMGATIEVESVENYGSTFTIRFPGYFENKMFVAGAAEKNGAPQVA